MGSSSSKGASATKTVSSSITRKYPTRKPPTNSQAPRPTRTHVGPRVHSVAPTSDSKSPQIKNDASDPQLSPTSTLSQNSALNARLAQLGPVQPNPTQSNSSTFNSSPTSQPASFPHTADFQPSASSPQQSIFPNPRNNPAVSLLTARYRLAEEAENEFDSLGRRGSGGRSFLDVLTLRQVLVLRGKGMRGSDIERALELKEGSVQRLGREGVVGIVNE